MLRFNVFDDGRPARSWPLRNAHLLGPDNVGVRGTIHFDPEFSQIICDKRAVGPTALALQVPLEHLGEFTMQTCLLPDRQEPYLLWVELARHRIMQFMAKQEDWAMFELPAQHPAQRRIHIAKQLFVEALNAQDEPVIADQLARGALTAAVDASEELALAHAEVLLRRRRMTGSLNRVSLGCGIGLDQRDDSLRAGLLNHFDYVRLPTCWRQLEPREQEHNWSMLDEWANWSIRNRVPVLAGPIICFEPHVVPDWLYIWEHDYDTIRDLLYEYAQQLVSRYSNAVALWNIVSGLHVNDNLSFSFEQLMDLTRMIAMLTKKLQPAGRTLIEISQPFGEYYCTNQRSIPPIMYAEMLLQSGIPFDAFGLKLLMGESRQGRFTRDLMQLSSMLDRFSGLGKPLHITAVAVPSKPPLTPVDPDVMRREPAVTPDDNSGYWRKPWSSLVQSHWLEAFYNIALSKPFVESIAWADFADHSQTELMHSGLIMDNMRTKSSFQRLATLRKNIHNAQTQASRPAGIAQS